MENMSRIGEGHKFGLISNPKEESIAGYLRNCLETWETEGRYDFHLESIVPFSDVDGLTLNELRAYRELLYEGTFLVFVMYDSIIIREKSGDNYKEPRVKGYVRYIYMIDTREKSDCTIDEVIVNHLKEKIHTTTKNKHRFQSFIAKYGCEGVAVEDETDENSPSSAASYIKK